jgi:hypothetical protein
VPLARAGGVPDASCAVLARIALRLAPRFAIAFVDASGRIHAQAPMEGDKSAFLSHHALLVNPLGGRDNWDEISGWFRTFASEQARRIELSGLASEARPDYEAIDADLREAGERAIVLPPNEGFSNERAAEVSFIYDIPPETLRTWAQRHRRELRSSRPGRPRNR